MNIKQTVIKIKNTLTSAKTAEFCTNRKNEAINILPKNAQNPQETAKIAGILEEAKNKREVKATQPVESGRSMVEMLGVLAVIGVLSVAGIAGYQYAMTKYRANQIANEVNLASAQISFALAKPHKEDFDLTLGSPYDDGTLSSGFAFTYGCGTDPQWEGCLSGDATYYETLSGLPEDLCKTVAQLTQNLPYLVEQRVNDTVDTMGTSCSGDNNELVLLFEIDQYNADDSTGGSGNPNDDLPIGGVSPNEWPFIPISSDNYCTKDDDCVGNYITCYHGFCVQCLTDIDCQEGQYCFRGFCTTSKPVCVTSADCAEDEYCNASLGECFSNFDGSCGQDSDCPKSSPHCLVNGRCSPSECTENVECQFFGKGNICSGGKCYTTGCKDNSDCPLSGQSTSAVYCHADGTCNSSECYTNDDCLSSKSTVCILNKCYDACKSDSECKARDSRNPYCHADGMCNSYECSSNDDCSVTGKGKVCSQNKCYDACKSDSECKARDSRNPYCHADGTCNSSECSSNDDCSATGKGSICSGKKCYEKGCESDSECKARNSSYPYCHADGTCNSSECSSNDDCSATGKGSICSGKKCYEKGCESDSECKERNSSYPYCHADGTCNYRECDTDSDCPSSKGAQCIRNKCLDACKSDADCEAISSYLRYCLSNGVCHYSECRTNSECQTLNKGTKCVYDNVDYVYRCQE